MQTQTVTCTLSEEELWSGIDRSAPEIEQHLAGCPKCRDRAKQFRAGIEAVHVAEMPPVPPIPSRIGNYRVFRRIGEGGMGIVYEGEQKTPKRPVALKVIRGGQFVDEYRLRLFQREAQTLGRLKHPAIAAIYEAGRTEDGQHFFAMELVRGVPLNTFVREQQIPRRRRLELFGKVCEAINYAHQRGVIHRDLKPSNILVDGEGQPKILDFGLARISDPDAPVTTTTFTAFGKIMGTLPYMSPEEASGRTEEIDIRSDVYSLGVIFYELMTDQLPYTVSRAALHEAVRVICEESPRWPSSIDRTLRGDLETIALKAMEKEPSRRYQSAAGFAEDVHRYLTDQPVLASRAGVFYRFRKLVIRHKFAAAFATTLVALILVGAISIEWTAHKMNEIRLVEQEYTELSRAADLTRLARDQADLGRYEKAERTYLTAINMLLRLERSVKDTRIGRAMLGLAVVIIDRGLTQPGDRSPEDLERDYNEAENWLAKAEEIFRERSPDSSRDMRDLMLARRKLYAPDALNDPDQFQELNEQLKGVRTAPTGLRQD